MNQALTNPPTQHLVLTAIGKDKTGLVSELTGLVAQCKCNILDSKMAIFGSEFTMIMLLAGDNTSLAKLEIQLPPLAMTLNLLTMMKRTTAHTGHDRAQYLVNIEGPDRSGTIRQLTSYFAENTVSINSLKSRTINKNSQVWQVAEISIDMADELDLDKIMTGLASLCASIYMTSTYSPITIEQ